MTQMADSFKAPPTDRLRALEGVPLATFGRRAAALTIDFFLVGVLFLAVSVGLPMLAIRWGLLTISDDVNLRFTFFGNWYSVIVLVAYFTLATWLGHGQTVGKRLCRIRVVSLVHDHLTLWHAFERALGYGASALEAGFGFFQYFIRPDRRTVHDRIAETIVVEERKAELKFRPTVASDGETSTTPGAS
jgi:uncharacterized RDD family membrane protein YckC